MAAAGAATRTVQPLLSWRVDAFFRVDIATWFAVQAELGFGPIGGGILASNGYVLLTGISANELSLPILGVFSLSTKIGVFSLMVGAFAAYPLGYPQHIENNGLLYTTSPLGSAFYLGLAGGCEYRLTLGPGSLVVDARYTHRFLSVTPETLAMTPLAVELTAGYMIPLRTRP